MVGWIDRGREEREGREEEEGREGGKEREGWVNWLGGLIEGGRGGREEGRGRGRREEGRGRER